MKIYVFYEDNRNRTPIEVPDEECAAWVERDYQKRLADAEDKSSVLRRTPQEIMDEDFNRPTYNNQHAETRRHVSFDALDPMGDTVIGAEDVELDLREVEYANLYEAIRQLEPQQQEMLRKVFWKDIKEIEIAKAEGLNRSSVSMRMVRIYSRLKKILEKMQQTP